MYPLESKGLVIHLLETYSALDKDWDGYGAEPIDSKIIDRAKQMLDGLIAMPDVYPTSASTIQFEFERGEDYLEVEIERDCLKILICHNNDYKNAKSMVIPNELKLPDDFIINSLIKSEISSLLKSSEFLSNKVLESLGDLREMVEKNKDGN